jgi:peptide-methionine (R)-S-oxide reductase
MGAIMNQARRVLLGLAGLAGGGALLQGLTRSGRADAAGASDGTPGRKHVFEVVKTDAEWRRMLTPAQFRVLRQAGTEYPFSSPLDREKRPGTFACAGCGLPLFSSDTKFDSGTGWPSFWKPLENVVVEDSDFTLGMKRVEVLCRRCGGHLGHVFEDGPPPTGLRYCMNGVAMSFSPRDDKGPAREGS